MEDTTLYNVTKEARVASHEAQTEVSEETQSKWGPWVIATAVTIGALLFALISNPTFAAWLSGTGS